MSTSRLVIRRILALFLIDIVSVWVAMVLWLSVGLGIMTGDYGFPLYIFIGADEPGSYSGDLGWLEVLQRLLLGLGIPTLVILVLQALLLAPVLGKPSIQPGKGRSIITSGVLAGFVAAVLLTGIAIGIGEWFLAESSSFKKPENFDNAGLVRSAIIFMIALPISWAIFGVLFSLALLRSQSPNSLKRLVSAVLVASAAEYVLLIPINIVVNRRTECFCSQGSFLALGFSVAAFAVLVGPFVLLIFCNHRYRNQARATARSESND